MKTRPILMSSPMVRALIAGTKTQTRREYKARNGGVWPNINDRPGMLQILRNSPYGQPGDRLWVRETWMPDPPCDGTWGYTEWAGCREGQIAAVPEQFRKPDFCNYRASWPHKEDGMRWTPGIHMPRWASRITLEVTGVRLERLQDISEADAMAEGIVRQPDGGFGLADSSHYHYIDPRISYWSLWEAINGGGSVDANPRVWCVEFRRVT